MRESNIRKYYSFHIENACQLTHNFKIAQKKQFNYNQDFWYT
jgi:hypothetical protein